MGRSGGISSSIVGTLLCNCSGCYCSDTIWNGTAIYLTEYTQESKVTRIIRFSAESLAGIPSIVYGLLVLFSSLYI